MTAPATAAGLVPLLERWHADLLALADALERAPRFDRTISTEDLDARTAALRELRAGFVWREHLKQCHVWPLVRRHVARGNDLMAELTASKRQVEERLLELRWQDERSPTMQRLIDELDDDVRRHVAVESRALLRVAAQVPVEAQERAGAKLASPSRLLPVQPHPDLPETPWIAAALAPVVGALDRLRDRFSTAAA